MQSEDKLLENFVINHTREAVGLVEKSTEDEIIRLAVQLPAHITSRLFSLMDVFQSGHLLKKLDVETASKIMNALPVNIAAAILRPMDQESRERLLQTTDSDKIMEMRSALSFPKDTIGAYIDPAIFTLNHHLMASEALERVKTCTQSLGNYVPVLDNERILKGYLSMQDLIATSDSRTRVAAIMKPPPPSLLADTRISENLLEGRSWPDSSQIPVVDSQGQFLGAINSALILEIKTTGKSSLRQAWKASGALAELYQIGLTSLFRSTDE